MRPEAERSFGEFRLRRQVVERDHCNGFLDESSGCTGICDGWARNAVNAGLKDRRSDRDAGADQQPVPPGFQPGAPAVRGCRSQLSARFFRRLWQIAAPRVSGSHERRCPSVRVPRRAGSVRCRNAFTAASPIELRGETSGQSRCDRQSRGRPAIGSPSRMVRVPPAPRSGLRAVPAQEPARSMVQFRPSSISSTAVGSSPLSARSLSRTPPPAARSNACASTAPSSAGARTVSRSIRRPHFLQAAIQQVTETPLRTTFAPGPRDLSAVHRPDPANDRQPDCWLPIGPCLSLFNPARTQPVSAQLMNRCGDTCALQLRFLTARQHFSSDRHPHLAAVMRS